MAGNFFLHRDTGSNLARQLLVYSIRNTEKVLNAALKSWKTTLGKESFKMSSLRRERCVRTAQERLQLFSTNPLDSVSFKMSKDYLQRLWHDDLTCKELLTNNGMTLA